MLNEPFQWFSNTVRFSSISFKNQPKFLCKKKIWMRLSFVQSNDIWHKSFRGRSTMRAMLSLEASSVRMTLNRSIQTNQEIFCCSKITWSSFRNFYSTRQIMQLWYIVKLDVSRQQQVFQAYNLTASIIMRNSVTLLKNR